MGRESCRRFGRLAVFCSAITFALLADPSFSLAKGHNQVRKIVVFESGFVNIHAQQALVEKFGAVAIKSLPLVNGMSVVLPLPAVKALILKKEVLRIDDDVVVYALPKPSAPPAKRPKPDKEPPAPQEISWGVDRIDAEFAWVYSTGFGVKVAVLDTGIDYSHPDLAANCMGGYNAINSRKSYKDDNGHGTHVAGIIAAADNDIGVVGVAPQASLYGVKALNRSGSGYLSDIIDSLNWCVLNDMDIVNMSLGTNSYIKSFDEACEAAANAGVILVAAAGNDGGAVDYPAAHDSVIAVAATDINDARAYFSSYGSEVDIAAPGVDIYSTWKDGGYETCDGTSMASPHVAGTLALNLGAFISEIAEDLPPAGYDIFTGYGLVDAEKAATGLSDYGDDLPLY